jgi:L-serine dehydratase
MFISTLDLFKLGIGPSSSHTIGPIIAAGLFIHDIRHTKEISAESIGSLRCTLTDSLAHTGRGHSSDNALLLGLHGYSPQQLTTLDIAGLLKKLWHHSELQLTVSSKSVNVKFNPRKDIIFDKVRHFSEHPNGMVFDLFNTEGGLVYSQTYFSIGGGFIHTLAEMNKLIAPIKMLNSTTCTYPFEDAKSMLSMANDHQQTIAEMKYQNELQFQMAQTIDRGLETIWKAMKACVEKGLSNEGILPGGLAVKRRAHDLHQQLVTDPKKANLHEWLCAYAMAVNEENAAGHAVVTAPTNGAAGIIPAVLYYCYQFEQLTSYQVHEFLLTAAAIGGIIKHMSSISGAEVGCQGEVGSASAMAAAGLCAIKGGSPEQVENAAEIALEHHLGMTCDPVKGLVQIPCIERNGFGALKAYTAASLALRGSGQHIMSLDNCIEAMRQTGMEMSVKFKETSLGGLAVNYTEC